MKFYLAVDIGASNGRHIVSHVEDGRIVLEEIYRFENTQIQRNGHDCWDVEALWGHILEGLRACKARDRIPVSMGIDTWAVDFLLLDGEGRPLTDAVAYRDKRTEGMREALEPVLPFAEHYAKTGIQYQPFNTVYQLAALKKEAAEGNYPLFQDAIEKILKHGETRVRYVRAQIDQLIKDLCEFTGKTWDEELLAAVGLPRRIFGEPVMPGARLGRFTAEVKEAVGFDCEVVLPATHDTGSAFLAVPARDDRAVTLSSGTWSLLGVENAAAITGPDSCAANFTNEGGYEYRYRYLKNIMGLWMIQSIRRELTAARPWSYAELEAEARRAGDFQSLVDVNDAAFLAPASMIEAVKEACRRSGQAAPETVGELMQCVYRSLARCYADAVEELSELTGKRYTSINIVGGGSKDGYLNELTAGAAGLPVFAGPTEGTALGNLMVQMIAAGEFADLQAARAAIPKSLPIKEVQP